MSRASGPRPGKIARHGTFDTTICRRGSGSGRAGERGF